MPATSAKTIGTPADDGARVIDVTTVDKRTRDITIDSPSVGVQRVRLLLPSRYTDEPSTRWPVLYLLHGAGGDDFAYQSWTASGLVARLTATAKLLVVMPSAGASGWYSDWWNYGAGGPPRWETFHVVELTQLLERNWQAGDKRVIAGFSMGGMGAMAYAARHPGVFLAAASYSGVLDPLGAGVTTDGNGTWGDPTAQVDIWRAHDPLELAAALKGTALYVSYGDGLAGPLDHGVVTSDDPEGWIHGQGEAFVARLHALNIAVTVDAYGPGTHTAPYMERAFQRSLPMLLIALGQPG